jgi:type I restriction enzyme S subunit
MENLNASILGRVPLQLPPVAEQALILGHIGKQSTFLDDLIGKANAAIALMREHRTALISAAVTGKIDIRDASYA